MSSRPVLPTADIPTAWEISGFRVAADDFLLPDGRRLSPFLLERIGEKQTRGLLIHARLCIRANEARESR